MDKPLYIDGISSMDVAQSLSDRQLLEQLKVMFKLLDEPSDCIKVDCAWLCTYGIHLLIEYQHRYEVVHSTKNNIMTAIVYWWTIHEGNYTVVQRFFEPEHSLIRTASLADLDRDTVYTDTWTKRTPPTWVKQLPTLTRRKS